MSTMTVIRGDTDDSTITFKDADGNAIDITGATVFFTVKLTENLYDDNDNNAVIKKDITTHADPTNGQTTLGLSATDTALNSKAEYYFDIQLKNTGGEILSGQKGDFVVAEDVSKRTV